MPPCGSRERARYPYQQRANKKYQIQARWRCRSRDHGILCDVAAGAAQAEDSSSEQAGLAGTASTVFENLESGGEMDRNNRKPPATST